MRSSSRWCTCHSGWGSKSAKGEPGLPGSPARKRPTSSAARFRTTGTLTVLDSAGDWDEGAQQQHVANRAKVRMHLERRRCRVIPSVKNSHSLDCSGPSRRPRQGAVIFCCGKGGSHDESHAARGDPDGRLGAHRASRGSSDPRGGPAHAVVSEAGHQLGARGSAGGQREPRGDGVRRRPERADSTERAQPVVGTPRGHRQPPNSRVPSQGAAVVFRRQVR